MSKKGKLYNYIINTLGLSKEAIFDIVRERVDDILSKSLTNEVYKSNYFQNLVLSKLEALRENRYHSKFYKHDDYIDILKEAVRLEVKTQVVEKLRDRYVIKIIDKKTEREGDD